MKKSEERIDITLIRKGIFTSIKEAKAFIMAGEVLVNGFPVLKSDYCISEDDKIEIKKRNIYVSRGAFKIEKAFKDFQIDLEGKKVIDIGISNGGFTDLMLKRGVTEVLGIDVNIKQLDFKIASDSRVKLLKLNARYIDESHIKFKPDLIVIDVSFISVLKILEPLRSLGSVKIISLIKPQFEAEKKDVTRGGIILSPDTRRMVVLDLKKRIENIGFAVLNFTEAGIKGKKGNQEYFFLLEYGNKRSLNDKIVENGIKI